MNDLSAGGDKMLARPMVTLRYLTPFAFLALVPLGGWLGGAWTFMAAAATPLALVVLDGALGEDEAQPQEGGGLIWLPRTYVFLQLATTAWAASVVARPATGLAEGAGLAISIGVTTGVFGFVAAHELIHSRSACDRVLGLTLLGTVFYMHFRIAHVHGHHRRAATFEDPASARLGEGLYAFMLRSVWGQLRESWTFEAKRRGGNRMIAYLAIEAALVLTVALLRGRALAFLVLSAIIAIALLESFNYVAHYGLTRRVRSDGRLERLGPRHSWNSARWMNNAALFNMGRHSDHHRRTTRPYEQLQPLAGAALLPSGYAAALLTALVPPLWRRIMDPRARAAMASA
jgi:alkane 1-monooxygenase